MKDGTLMGRGSILPIANVNPITSPTSGGSSLYVPFTYYKTHRRLGRDIFVSWDSDTLTSFYFVSIAVFDFDPKTGDDPDPVVNVFANYNDGLYVSRAIDYTFAAGDYLKHTFTAPTNNQYYWYITFMQETDGGTMWVIGHNNSADYISSYSAPDVTYSSTQNKITFSNYTSGNTCAIEVYNPNYTPLNTYSLDHKNVFYEACMRLSEFGVHANSQTYYDRNKLHRFSSATKKLKVINWHSTSIEYIAAFNDMIDDWITNINSLITSGTQFQKDESAVSPDIRMYFGTPLELWGDAGARYGGTWNSYYDSNGYITYSEVRVNTQTFINEGWDWTTFNAIITEELTEACGCGNDLSDRADCIFTEFAYPIKNPTGAFNSIDESVIKLLYNESLPINGTTDQIAVLVNPEIGLMSADTVYFSPYVNLNNFSQQTSYDIRRWQVDTSNKSSVLTSWQSITTPDYPDTPDSPTLVKRVDGGFQLTWDSVTNADWYILRRGTDEIIYTNTIVYTVPHTTTGLLYGQTYYVGAQALSTYLPNSSFSSNNVVTTAPKTPTLSFVSATNTSITVSIGVSTGNWSFVKAWYRLKNSADAWQSITITNPTTTGTITGLTTGSEYEIKASSFYTVSGTDIESVDASGNTSFSSLIYAKAVSRPTNWAWTTTITAGTDVPSVSGKTIYIMPATEWNAFTDRINDFREYINLADYTFTSVSTDTEFTKTIINQALTAIRDMSAYFTGGKTVPADRVTGDNILLASVYQNMRDAMNSIA
jgi:hypothetical protein